VGHMYVRYAHNVCNIMSIYVDQLNIYICMYVYKHHNLRITHWRIYTVMLIPILHMDAYKNESTAVR